MLDIIITVFFLLIYLSVFLLLILNKTKIIFYYVLIFILFYDYIFINLSELFKSSALLNITKAWQEFFLISLLVYAFLKKRTNLDKPFQIGYYLIGLSVFGAAVGLIKDNQLFEIIVGWRMYFVPIIIFYLCYKLSLFDAVEPKSLIIVLTSLTFIFVLYAFVKDITFRNDLKESLWFYDYINNLVSIESTYESFIRNNGLRATSYFVSPLIFASYLSLPVLFILYSLIIRKDIEKYFLALPAIFFLYGIFISRARIGLVNTFIGFVASYMIYKFRRYYKYAFLAPLGGIAFTLVGITFGLVSDESALGRVGEYIQFANLFEIWGLGFGNSYTKVYFDSWYISVGLLFGIAGIFYLLLNIRIMTNYFHVYKDVLTSVNTPKHDRILFYSLFGFGMSFFYMFAFQYTIGYNTINLYYFLTFYLFSRLERYEKISYRADSL